MPSEWREDPVTGRRVRFAPARADRPNDFAGDDGEASCPFCAGAEERTPPEIDRVGDGVGGWLARAIPNRYPAVEGADGAHEVIVESPQHITRFVDLSADEATAAVTLWCRRLMHWRADAAFGSALVFKNEGPAAGASLAHTHSQVVALPSGSWTPVAARSGDAPEERRVFAERDFVAHCPVAPRFAGEAWVVADTSGPSIAEIAADADAARRLAALLQLLVGAVCGVTAVAAFNLMVIDDNGGPGWRIEVAPRTSAIAGFELATGLWINAFTPEAAAARLRAALDA